MQVLSSDDLGFLKSVILEAGGMARRIQQGDFHPERKEDSSLVTLADLEVQRYLVERISGRFPGIGFIHEEAFDKNSAELKTNSLTAVIDPIDGTAVYSMMLPTWSISLGIFRGTRPLYGFVYSPGCGMLFHNDDENAYLNDRILKVDRNMRVDSETNVFIPGELFSSMHIRYRGKVRNFGSTALHACLVADNRRNRALAFYGQAYIWDWAGAYPVILKAGGQVRYLDGGEVDFAEVLRNGCQLTGYAAAYSKDDFDYVRSIIEIIR